MSEDSQRIQNVITESEYSAHGIFRFKFYIGGKWVSINVDDRLPVSSWRSGFWPFATGPSANGAWWMPLLEKAYAKLN